MFFVIKKYDDNISVKSSLEQSAALNINIKMEELQMNKVKRMEIRVTEEDVAYVDNERTKLSMSRSEFIRQAIRGKSNVNTKEMATKIVTMQGIINRMNTVGVTQEEVNILGKEMRDLWQLLK